jgi:hypothetical protein
MSPAATPSEDWGLQRVEFFPLRWYKNSWPPWIGARHLDHYPTTTRRTGGFTIRRSHLYLVALALLIATRPAMAADVPLHGETVVHFATVTEGRRVVSTPDAFTKALSRADLEYRLGTNSPVRVGDLLKFAADQVLPFSAADEQKLREAVERVRPRLQEFELPLPDKIFLVKTTGREESGAGYCRQNAIVFPKAFLSWSADDLDRLFLHEFFHVLSNQNEPLRRKLYAIIGFRPCPPVDLPADLADIKLTNPDGPSLEYCITLDTPTGRRTAVPLLLVKAPFDPDAPARTMFAQMSFRLLVVVPEGDRSRPAEEGGEPILLDPEQTPSYMRQIGSNTDFIIHPDEILAENFVGLVQKTEDLPTPRIVQEMRRMLQSN